jgi:hypothetical protein
MRLLAILAASASAGLLLAAASPALAISGQCFWNQLEPPTRGALLEGYQRLGPQVLDRVPISERELTAIDVQCGAQDAPGDLKDRLLTAVVLEHGSAVFLKGWLHWDDQAIQDAWSRLGPEAISVLRRQAQAVLAGVPPEDADLSGAVGAFLGRDPSREDPGLVDQARGYLTSRAMREAIERRQP